MQYLRTGGFLSVVSSLSVVVTYSSFKSWRKHPNPLIYYRSLCELLFGLRFLLGPDGDSLEDTDDCQLLAGVTQFAALAAESWFAMMCIDLLASLTNPFTSYTRNLKLYHAFCWTAGGGTALLLVSLPDAYGLSSTGFCWTRSVSSFLNPYSWTLMFAWMLAYMMISMAVLVFANVRLHFGLPETYETRREVLMNTTKYVLAFAGYWLGLFAMYVTFIVVDPEDVSSGESWIKNAFRFVLASKGYVCMLCWFWINDLGDLARPKTERDEANLDVDLSPQELLWYTTMGLTTAARQQQSRAGSTVLGRPTSVPAPEVLAGGCSARTLLLERKSTSGEGGARRSRGTVAVPRCCVRVCMPRRGPIVFQDFEPDLFQRTRELFGIRTDEYVASLSETAGERLSEGASGAFMFFSKDHRYIVKSTSRAERDFLLSVLGDYYAHLAQEPQSFLTRFYGCHSISLYNQEFSFVVMANLFNTDRYINARYDIKGSWVNRNADPTPPGKKTSCRHCNRAFHFGSGEQCGSIIGPHEPNVVLKDNDLSAKIRIEPHHAARVLRQLKRDAALLASLGVMDYSLLAGVSNDEFSVDAWLRGQGGGGQGAPEDSPADGSGEGSGEGRQSGDRKSVRPLSGSMSRSGSSGSDDAYANDGQPPSDPGDEFAIPAHVIVGPSHYYLGIIDVLQEWNWEKRLERFFKVRVRGQDARGISAVPPAEYLERFCKKMDELFALPPRQSVSA